MLWLLRSQKVSSLQLQKDILFAFLFVLGDMNEVLHVNICP